MGTNSQKIYPQRNRDVPQFKFVNVVDSVDSDDGTYQIKKVTTIELNDARYFPEDQVKIDGDQSTGRKIVNFARRQKWEKDDSAFINWPDDGTGHLDKNVRNITRVTIHGVYMDGDAARQAAKILDKQYQLQSFERRKRALAEADETEAHETSAQEVSVRDTTPQQPTKKARPSTSKDEEAKLDKVLEIVQADQHNSQIRDKELAMLKQWMQKMERSMQTQGSKLDKNGKSLNDLRRSMTKKVTPSIHFASGIDRLFDEDLSIVYMGIDRTTEINDLFIEYRQKEDADFARGLAKLWYGDDLYWWMFEGRISRKKNDRKPLGKRDPEGVALVEKVFDRYFNVLVWPCHPEHVALAEEIRTCPPEAASKLRSRLEITRQSKTQEFTHAAKDWMNDWGTEARGTKRPPSFWEQSLFGRSVLDAAAKKPSSYDENAEMEWRRHLFTLKSTKRTIETFLEPPDL